jgi:hypothetical protein
MHLVPNHPSDRSLEDDLAAELVRCFAAVDALLRKQREQREREQRQLAPGGVAETLRGAIAARLRGMDSAYGHELLTDALDVLSEAVDNLGHGESLDPGRVPAFRGSRDA